MILWLSLLPLATDAFLTVRRAGWSTRRYYKNDPEPEQQPSPRNTNAITIPVLGPIPGKPPLLIGTETTLPQPTPMQWQTLEEALWQHNMGSNATSANVEAAPLVALMDETNKNQYATLCAVVGWHKGEEGDSLVEGTVRLVGIGRARLSDFFYQVPARYQEESVDEDGYLLEETLEGMPDDDEDEDHDEDDEETEDLMAASRNRPQNIVMAQFRLIQDAPVNGDGSWASPVHALNGMATWASKIQRLHSERRRMVAGLHTAKARLSMAEDDLEDLDGIGLVLSANRELEVGGEVAPTLESSLAPAALPAKQPKPLTGLERYENYGMGFTAASISNLPELARVWMGILEPYYSPERRASEEFYYEVLSYVGMHTMDRWLGPSHMSWALQCTNTMSRLQQVHDWMSEHVRQLNLEAAKVSEELRQCGEECTDLF